MAGQEIKTAIEHIISDYELKDPDDSYIDDITTNISQTLDYSSITNKNGG